VDVFTILVWRLGDIEPVVFQQTFLEEEYSRRLVHKR